MIVSTVTFDRTDAPHDFTQADIDALHGVVMEAFNRHFAGFGKGAEAQQAFGQLRADINADTTLPLFDVMEAFRATLESCPAAREWSAFENDGPDRALLLFNAIQRRIVE